MIDAQLSETTRLAETIQTWWPALLVALSEDASNARTEGSTASSSRSSGSDAAIAT